jgi:hypothetical protein
LVYRYILKKEEFLAQPKLKIDFIFIFFPLVTFIICKNIVELRLWDKRPMEKVTRSGKTWRGEIPNFALPQKT